ncbi:MAG: hypothetical protein HYU66_26950, partial [Armatimonadetes bacterium]|nr:hypothetical protein [Armatimonadota bacterium]
RHKPPAGAMPGNFGGMGGMPGMGGLGGLGGLQMPPGAAPMVLPEAGPR